MELQDTGTCFACGKNNPDGLKLPLEVDARGARFTWVIPGKYQGWSGIAHGGIIATLLDELMAWAVRPRGYRTVTAELSVRFRRPVPVDKAISGFGWITEEQGRLVLAKSQLTDTNGQVLAEATGKLWKV